MAKNIAVFGIYNQMTDVESALNELKVAGFRNEDVSVLFPENLGSKELATVKATKGPEGATVGGGSGAVIGGALGWLAGIGARHPGGWAAYRRWSNRCCAGRDRGRRSNRRSCRRSSRYGTTRI